MDKYMMDGHKLLWHLDRVLPWLKGERAVPLHMDIGISKGCTINCVYCYGVNQGRVGPKGFYIPKEPLIRFMRDAAEIGVKAISITGEAEPTMNPAVYDAVLEGRKAGLSIGLATWGGTLKKDRLLDLAENLVWIRFNISAGDEESYQKIHGTSKENFKKVVMNIEKFVDLRRQKGLPLTVGLQMVTMPWYAEEAIKLAKLGKDIGVDYLEIKHCSDTYDGKMGVEFEDYQKVIDVLKVAESVTDDNYNVVVKWNKILAGKERSYDVCYCAGNFMLRMSGNGVIYPCAQFFDMRSEEFAIGSIIENSLKDLFYNERYLEVLKRIQCLDVHKECYSGCKENYINEFLWTLKNPPPHIHFV
jgi:radical SAM protein with 4Fe4S-binding SPASM domain